MINLSFIQKYWVPIVAVSTLFFCVFFISRCESQQQEDITYTTLKAKAKQDSIIVASQTLVAVYRKQALLAADSVAYYKRKVATLDSVKRTKLIQYEKPIKEYRTLLAHNPDSARRSFLSKRFPDLYPH